MQLTCIELEILSNTFRCLHSNIDHYTDQVTAFPFVHAVETLPLSLYA